jgi:hypothetical protein
MNRFDELIEETKNEISVLLRDPEKFFPYFPKGIADACWIPDHPLVFKLNEIVDIYNNRKC